MSKFPRPWFICGGWAVDLFLGRETRAHHDIEIGLLRSEQLELLSYLDGWSFEKVAKGNPPRIEPWERGELLQLPIHEAYARKDDFVLEILLNEYQGGDWHFRRDMRVRSPLASLAGSYEGIPFLNPQFVLLYKARNPKEKDHLDLNLSLSKMTAESRHWLRDAIQLSEGKDHPWIPIIFQGK